MDRIYKAFDRLYEPLQDSYFQPSMVDPDAPEWKSHKMQFRTCTFLDLEHITAIETPVDHRNPCVVIYAQMHAQPIKLCFNEMEDFIGEWDNTGDFRQQRVNFFNHVQAKTQELIDAWQKYRSWPSRRKLL